MTATLLSHPAFVRKADAQLPLDLKPPKRRRKLATFDADRHFWPNVDRSGGPGACHLWTGTPDPANAYGRLWGVEGIPYAHRKAWEVAHGRKVPKGKCVLHACNTHLCCNSEPGHIYLGTHKQNTADAIAAGTHGKRKLNADMAREIYRLANAPGRDYRSIAERFGITRNTVFRIAKGIRWAKATRHGKDHPRTGDREGVQAEAVA